MLKPRKAPPAAFKPGVSGNPKGKPKGAVHIINKRMAEVRAKACEDAGKAYSELRQAMGMGHSWAHQIFWKEVAQHEYRLSLTNKLKLNGLSLEDKIKFIQELVLEFPDYALTDLLNILKSFKEVKTDESTEAQVAIVMKTREEQEKQIADYVKAIDHMRQQEK